MYIYVQYYVPSERGKGRTYIHSNLTRIIYVTGLAKNVHSLHTLEIHKGTYTYVRTYLQYFQ